MKKRQLGLAMLVLVAAAATPRPADEFHFALSRSEPAADATVQTPAQIKLWFTQVPRPGTLAVRLVNAAGQQVELAEPKADEADAKIVSAAIARALPAGAYTVAWRGAGDDGHMVQNEFAFRVTAE